jgi:lipopolysaccharide/colanic/teichoic acid biosynthesis glycosyltransferase
MSVPSDPKSPPQNTQRILSILPGRLWQLAFLLLAILSSMILWHRMGTFGEYHQGLDALVLISMGMVISMTTALGLHRGNRKKDILAYRLTLYGGVSLVTIRWAMVWWLTRGGSPPFYLYILLVLSLFTGGVFASSRHYGLIEDTFPPSEAVTQEVKKKYLDYTSQPRPIPVSKRLFDMFLSSLGIIVSTPLWVSTCILLWLQDPGPIFFIKNCGGYQGENFRLLKFRTMRLGAEKETGPIASKEQDQRVHGFGLILRKTALDELPQLLNILRGEMSFVGPRPLRTVVEAEYLKTIPGYAARYNVLPGLSGLAQIAGDYYLPSRDKLRYERIYANHSSLGFDIKLILLAFVLVFWLRWQKDWDGRVPRSWIRWTPNHQKQMGRIK